VRSNSAPIKHKSKTKTKALQTLRRYACKTFNQINAERSYNWRRVSAI